MNTFDPSVYERKTDYQREPDLPDDKWVERFVAYIVEEGAKSATDEFKKELPDYARKTAPSYLAERKEYVTPEEAAWTDISYWEDEE